MIHARIILKGGAKEEGLNFTGIFETHRLLPRVSYVSELVQSRVLGHLAICGEIKVHYGVDDSSGTD